MFGKSKKPPMVLIGTNYAAYLLAVPKSAAKKTTLEILAETDTGINNDVTLPRLLASASKIRGEVSLTLPLHFFQTLSLSIPKIPEETVGKTLPYHLGKNLDQPLADFIYDWQIVQRRKDTLNVNVYLYSLESYAKIDHELKRNQLQLKHFEADIFSAFAYLEQNKRLPVSGSGMCVLIWNDSITVAIYENGVIPLCRTLGLIQPKSTYNGPVPASNPQLSSPKQAVTHEIGQNDRPVISMENDEDNSILAGFNLLQSETEEEASGHDVPEDDSPAAAEILFDTAQEENKDDWENYIEKITLEIMRTRDYYLSVIKGSKIQYVTIAGAEIIWDRLQEGLDSSLEISMEPLLDPEQPLICPPIFHALSIGAGRK